MEATTLNERCLKLRPQDEFIRDNIASNDTLIVSIGGNDIALYPTPCTIFSMLGALFCLPTKCREHGFSCFTLPVRILAFSFVAIAKLFHQCDSVSSIQCSSDRWMIFAVDVVRLLFRVSVLVLHV